jgi:cytochrome c553
MKGGSPNRRQRISAQGSIRSNPELVRKAVRRVIFLEGETKMDRIVSQSLRSTFWVFGVLLFFSVPAWAQGDGASLFKAKCAACHGADGKGDTSMGKAMKLRDLGSDDVQKQTDAELTEITANGKGKMPAYEGKLTDDQIKQLVGYIRSLKKK